MKKSNITAEQKKIIDRLSKEIFLLSNGEDLSCFVCALINFIPFYLTMHFDVEAEKALDAFIKDIKTPERIRQARKHIKAL